MHLVRRFTRGELHLGRIEAFSDGIFVVAVTLLVLDLKVPVLQDRALCYLVGAVTPPQGPGGTKNKQ